MKQSWHVLAARCQSQHPRWTWSQICAAVGSRGRRRARQKPSVPQFTKKMEQLKLF